MRRISPRHHQGRSHSSPASSPTTVAPGDSIQVELLDDLPKCIHWQSRAFAVQSVDDIWCAEGRWWQDRKRCGTRRRYYRLSLLSPTGTPQCFEIYHQGAHWKLLCIAD